MSNSSFTYSTSYWQHIFSLTLVVPPNPATLLLLCHTLGWPSLHKSRDLGPESSLSRFIAISLFGPETSLGCSLMGYKYLCFWSLNFVLPQTWESYCSHDISSFSSFYFWYTLPTPDTPTKHNLFNELLHTKFFNRGMTVLLEGEKKRHHIGNIR